MPPLPTKEGEILILLFTDYSKDYNASSLSKKVGITRRGALKIVKKLREQEIVIPRQYGKAVFYKVNLNNAYARQRIIVALMEKAREKAKRWLFEFEKLAAHAEIVIIFGSAIRNYEKAHDIDLVIVYQQKKEVAIQKEMEFRRQISLKPIHLVRQSPVDFVRNLKKPDPVLLNALRLGCVLKGYEKIVDAVDEAQKAHGLFAVPEPELR